MSDVVLYNIPQIESHLGQVNALNAQGQDLSHQMDNHYQHLDNVSSGQGTSAGMEWAAQSTQIRGDAAEIVQLMHQAGMQAMDSQVHTDMWAKGVLGG